MAIGDAVNYILFSNPVSSSLGSVVSSAARSIGIVPKSPAVTNMVVSNVAKPIAQALPLYRLSGTHYNFIRLAGLSGVTAVMLGAYGSHKIFRPTGYDKEQDVRIVFETANRYHLIHSVVLLAMPLVRRPLLSGSLISAGMILFCGACYHSSLTNDKKYAKLAPVGGILLIMGWASLIL